MRKEYETPDFELTKLNFESILEEHLIEHSIGEGYAESGDEGQD